MPELRNRHELCREQEKYGLPSPLNPKVDISVREFRLWALDVSDSKAILKMTSLTNAGRTYDTSQLQGFSKVHLDHFVRFHGHHL